MNEVIGVALQAEGYGMLACGNGRDALHLLRSRGETCAILLDLNLPVMDGEQFRTAQLRDRSLAWIPVVVMSGRPGARWDAERLGAAAFIWKPVDVDELRGTFARLPCARTAPSNRTADDRCRRGGRPRNPMMTASQTPRTSGRCRGDEDNAVRCSLFAVRCSLFAVRCSLFAVLCSLASVSCKPPLPSP